MNKKRKIIAIVGPTASGKTGIGVKLAKEFGGEIISADSRQVYRGLDIGTGKDLGEYDGVKYHMIDIVDPEKKMTLFDYLPLARAAIEDIFSRGKLPIIVGGTGLYVQGLVEGFELEKTPDDVISTPREARAEKSCGERSLDKLNMTDKKYSRQELDLMKAEELLSILDQIAPNTNVDRKNRSRVIRAIELAQEGLVPVKVKPDFEVLQIGIDVPRAKLHENIDKRVDERFEAGMLEEVVCLLKQGVSPDWLIGLGLEYREITNFLLDCHFDSTRSEGGEILLKKISPCATLSRDDIKVEFELMKQQLKYRIHQFARRQLTWFRRFPEINWLSDYAEIKRFAKIFLEH